MSLLFDFSLFLLFFLYFFNFSTLMNLSIYMCVFSLWDSQPNRQREREKIQLTSITIIYVCNNLTLIITIIIIKLLFINTLNALDGRFLRMRENLLKISMIRFISSFINFSSIVYSKTVAKKKYCNKLLSNDSLLWNDFACKIEEIHLCCLHIHNFMNIFPAHVC